MEPLEVVGLETIEKDFPICANCHWTILKEYSNNRGWLKCTCCGFSEKINAVEVTSTLP